MTKRIIGLAVVSLLVLLAQLMVPAAALAQSSPIGDPSPANCASSSAFNTGTNPGSPGEWADPNKYGTGWDLYFVNDSIIVYWLTFDGGGRPVWLGNLGSSYRQSATDKSRYWGPLYYVVQQSDGSVTYSQVGYFSIAFVSGSTTSAAIRWQWNAVGSASGPDSCIYDLVPQLAGRPSGGGTSSSAPLLDAGYTGSWFSQAQSGWGLDVDIATGTGGGALELDDALIYDTAGQPVWVQGSIANPTAASTSTSLSYVKSLYPRRYPIDNCTNNACIQFNQNIGTLTRSFTDPGNGSSSIVANVPAATTGAASVAWPNPHDSNPAAINKLTFANSIIVNQTNCQIPAGQTSCALSVAWTGASTNEQIYRIDLKTNTVSQTPLATGSSGSAIDYLTAGADVQYALYTASSTGAPTGAALFLSPEVKATATSGLATPPPPSLAATPADDTASDSVGATGGKFSVDQAGNAQYDIPLYAPRGSGGLTPQLSLIYNSGFGDGLLGYGWQLGGFSTITVCRQAPEHGDGPSSGGPLTTNPATAAYCLDGQRMDLISGTNGAVGAVYRLEIDTISEIVVESATTTDNQGATNYTVPTVFAVYGKDGTVRHYGGSSAQLRYQPGASGGTTLAWYLTQIQDSNGNAINFQYSAPTPQTPAALVPASITYLGGEIDFATVPRSSAQLNMSYQAGAPVDTTPALLTSITVKSGTTVLRTYTPTYSAASNVINGTLSTITALTECGGSGASQVCYNPTTFAWASVGAFLSNQGSSYASSNQAFFHALPDGVKFGDVDGDGRGDVVYLHCDDGSCGYRDFIVAYSTPVAGGGVQLSTVTCNPTSNSTYDPNAGCPEFSKFYNHTRAWQLFDFNGDGRADLLMMQAQSYEGQTGPYQLVVWQSTGGNVAGNPTYPFTQKVVNLVASNVQTGTLGPMMFPNRVDMYMADYDGDGVPDLLTIDDAGTATVFLLKPTGNSTTPFAFQGPYNVAFGTPGSPVACLGGTGSLTRQSLRTADFNGDGRADVVLEFANGPCLPTSTGAVQSSFTLETTDTFVATVDQVEAAATSSAARGPISTVQSAYPCAQVGAKCLQAFTAVGVSGNSFYFQPSTSLMWQVGSNASTPANQRSVFNDLQFQVADLNGDGLTDVVFEGDKNSNNYAVWLYEINQGGTRGPSSCVVVTSTGCTYTVGAEQMQLGDYDGDGKVDFWNASPYLPRGTNVYYVYLWTGNDFAQTPIKTGLYSGDIGTTPEWFGYVADLDGDGYADSLEIDPSTGSWSTFRGALHHKPRNMVTSITSGLGAVTSLTYAPLTYTSVYFREYTGFYMHSGWGAPVQDVLAPRYVVEYADSSAPTDGAPGALSSIRYQYSGFKMQGGGRGSLGFDAIYTIDGQTGIETKTAYYQTFPLTGMPSQTSAWTNGVTTDTVCDPAGGGNPDSPACMAYGTVNPFQANQTEISFSSNAWLWHVWQATSDNTTLAAPLPMYVRRTSGRDLKFNLDGAVIGVQATSFSYDTTYGNVLSTITNEYNATNLSSANDLRQTITTQTWLNTDVAPSASNGYKATFHVGRMLTSYTTATPVVGGVLQTAQTITRNSEFAYDPTTGQLTAEHLQPMAPTDGAPAGTAYQALDKYHFYDTYGNETETVTCSATMACSATTPLTAAGMTFNPTSATSVQRYSRSVYGAYGIYANATYAPFSKGSTAQEKATLIVNSRDAFGNPTQATDLHNVLVVNAYSALGRPYFTATNTGSAAQTIYRWCSGHGQAGAPTVPCPSGAAYRVDTLTNAGGTARSPETWAYYDVLAREVLKVQQGFSSAQFYAVSTSYDNEGRVYRVSEPYLTFPPGNSFIGGANNTTIYYTTTKYDSQGRVVQVTHPNNSLTTTTYTSSTTGIDTKTTLPANGSGYTQTKTASTNRLGQIVTVTDANGSTLTNTYDAAGHVTSVVRLGNDGKSATTTMTYDALGRKTGLSDPDAGAFTFQYNALGEQIQKLNTSSTPTCTVTAYDGQGRPFSRTDYANATCSGTPDASASWTYDTAGNGLGLLASASSSDNASPAVGLAATETRNAYYDAYGRLSELDTSVNGYAYKQLSTYDQFGRAFQSLFSGTGLPQSGELYSYNAQGYLYQVQDAENVLSGQVYQLIQAMDARGHVTQEQHAANAAMTTVRSYDAPMGWLTGISTGTPSGTLTNGAIQNLSYSYDAIGNMLSRTDVSPGAAIYEKSSYDVLQRLSQQQLANSAAGPWTTTLSNAYDSFGNANSGTSALYGTYSTTPNAPCNGAVAGDMEVAAIGPDAVTGDPAGNDVRCYDSHGNVLRLLERGNSPATKRQIWYTASDLARRVAFQSPYSSHTTTWNYGLDRQRLVRGDYTNSTQSGSPVSVTHYVGNAEIDNATGTTRTVKRYIAGLIISQTTTGSSTGTQFEYLYTTNIGSTHRIVDQNGVVQSPNGAQWFDAYGKRSSPANGVGLDPASRFGYNDALTHHGFTGHEAMDESALIHMNGRVYDYNGGRFEQADRVVGDPSDLQSYNRYTYVLNNPLSSVDPSGYWGHRQQGYLRDVAAIAISVFAGVEAGEVIGMNGWGAASLAAQETAVADVVVGGFAAGYITSGNLTGAVEGAFDAGVSFGIGTQFGAGTFQNVAAHAIEGGVMAQIQGGKFGHGFISAGLSAAINPHINTGNRFADGIAVSIVGGTTSRLTGGKFANGALSSAFSYAFGSLATGVAQQRALDARMEAMAEQMQDLTYALAFEPPALPQPLVDFAAGAGDALVKMASFGYGDLAETREILGIDGATYGGAYTGGKYAGYAWGTATLWVAGLNGGSSSVFWSGYRQGARGIAEGLGGTTIADTPVGAALDFAERLGVPGLGPVWKAASATFAMNATGTARAVILSQGQIWSTIELPILTARGIPILYVP